MLLVQAGFCMHRFLLEHYCSQKNTSQKKCPISLKINCCLNFLDHAACSFSPSSWLKTTNEVLSRGLIWSKTDSRSGVTIGEQTIACLCSSSSPGQGTSLETQGGGKK